MDHIVEFEEQGLADFFQSAVNLLKCGISAEKLASIERISTEQVQLYLYKLSILGLVAPARRDDLWAGLDTVLQSKSTPLRLTEEQRANPRAAKPEGLDVARPWGQRRPPAKPGETNHQKSIANLLLRPEDEANGTDPAARKE